jgi:uncharacterized protein (TIGR00251 family)
MKRSVEYMKEAEGGSILHLLVSPGARSTEVDGVDEWRGVVRVRVAAEPREGAANAELIRFLSEKLSVSMGSVVIVKGSRNHRKSVFIPLETGEVKRKLELV